MLAEQPLHGYAVIGLLAQRSGGLWRPSPGSVYPVLAQLEDDRLVAAEESDGRRVFSLTEAGRAYVAEHAEALREPWNPTGGGDLAAVLFDAMRNLGGAAREVARGGDAAQIAAARSVLESARRSLYRILADDAPDATRPDDGVSTEGTTPGTVQ